MNAAITLHQQCRLLEEGDTQTPIRLYMQLGGQVRHSLLLESAEVDGRWGRYSLIASDYLAEFSCRQGKLAVRVHRDDLRPLLSCDGLPYVEGMREVTKALDIIPEHPGLAPISRALYGYWGYEMAAVFQPKLAQTLPIADAESHLVLPGTVLLFDHMYNKLYQLSLGEHRDLSSLPVLANTAPPNVCVGPVSYTPDEQHYCAAVRHVRELLHSGEAIQVVGSSQCSAELSGDTFTLYRRMRSLNPSPYMFYMRFEGLELFGASPEVMVQCHNSQLGLSPIAGTRKRGKDAAEDEQLAQEMLTDPKERAEHVMLVDLGRNDLGRIATAGSVQVQRLMDVERFSHVMHMTSRIQAELSPGKDAWDVLASTFPAGTVSGAPKIRAMEIIHEIEPAPRGPYAGCIGWLGLDRDAVHLDTGITIRSMWARGGKLYWQTGAGLVYDSVPEREWMECRNKGRIVDAILASHHQH